MKLKLVSRNPVTADVVSFVFEPDAPLARQPGQYLHSVLPHPDAADRCVDEAVIKLDGFPGYEAI